MSDTTIELTITELRIVGDFYQTFTPTASQTVFTLSRSLTAAEITRSRVFINGIKLINTIDYSITGDQLDVSGYAVTLTTTDKVEVYS